MPEVCILTRAFMKWVGEQEEWVAENRVEIAAQIEHGVAQAERSELIDGDEAVRRLADDCGQRAAFHILHRNEVERIGMADLVDVGDAGMVQRRGSPCFLKEPAQPALFRDGEREGSSTRRSVAGWCLRRGRLRPYRPPRAGGLCGIATQACRDPWRVLVSPRWFSQWEGPPV